MLRMLKILKNKLIGGKKVPSGSYERKGEKMTDEEKKEWKDIKNEIKRQWRKDNPEKQHAIDKKYDDNRKRKKRKSEYQKEWYQKNKYINKERRENGTGKQTNGGDEIFLSKTLEFIDELKNNRKVNDETIADMKSKARNIDAAIRLDYNKIQSQYDNMLNKHQNLILGLNKELQLTLKPVRKVFAIGIETENEKDRDSVVSKLYGLVNVDCKPKIYIEELSGDFNTVASIAWSISNFKGNGE